MTGDALEVRLHENRAGRLERPDPARPRAFRFTYDSEYLRARNAIALSHALPLQAQPFEAELVRNWFAGLLPEAAARESIARDLRVDATDDFALLAAIGGECAGAVQLVRYGEVPKELEAQPVALAHTAIERWIHERPRSVLALSAGSKPLRLSLAGAQDKLPVIATADDAIFRPGTSQPSTHILKVPNPEFPKIVIREALGLSLARHAGLNVAGARLIRVPTLCLLLERFDRTLSERGETERVHQEDLCQAAGLGPEAKYDEFGGWNAAEFARFLRDEIRIGPQGLETFLHWLAFNVAIGNADAHAKNLSLLRQRDGSVTVAPFYDLVPTSLYRTVGRGLALGIGDAKTIDTVTRGDWNQFARRAGFGPEYVRSRYKAVLAAVAEALPAAAAELESFGLAAKELQADLNAVEGRVAALSEDRTLPEPIGAWDQRPDWG